MTTQHKEEPKNAYFRNYYTQAKKLYFEKKYMQAAEVYSRSLEIIPTDKNCLVARSRCYLRLGKPAKALADAQLALQQDENFAEAMFQKAEAYYQQTNYEVALMVYHQGIKFPGRPDLFLNGIHKCEMAIEKSVHWLDQLPIYRSEEPVDCGKKDGLPEATTSSECIAAEPKVPMPHRDKMFNLLEEVYEDRKFLKKLLKNVEFKCESDWLSKLMIIDRLIYLNNQAKYLQTQKLAYRTGTASTPQNIKDDLEEIQATLNSKRYKDCIKECIKMAGDYDGTEWELRKKYILKLYSWIGASNMELKLWEMARCAFLALLWLGELCHDDELRLKALGAISLCYKNDIQSKPKNENQERTEGGEMSEIEEMDLYYYLGQCYLGLNNQKARGYGKMCYDTAVVGSSKEFMKAGLILMACADMKVGSFKEAMTSLKECEDLMTRDGDVRKETIEKTISEVVLLEKDQEKKKEAENKKVDEEAKKKKEEELENESVKDSEGSVLADERSSRGSRSEGRREMEGTPDRHIEGGSRHSSMNLRRIPSHTEKVVDISEIEPEMEPEMEPERYPEKEPERYPEKEPERYSEMEPERYPEMESERYPEMEPERYPHMEPERYPEMEPERYPHMKPERYPEMEPERYPHMEPERYPEMEPDMEPERESEREPERDYFDSGPDEKQEM